MSGHYRISDNMTDTLIALNAATAHNLESRHEILKDFESRWRDNALVFDNYFRAVASAPYPDTLDNVRKLMEHECFDLTNPNRVRALLGTFSQLNPECFNDISGRGYEFLTEILIKLNGTNPHVAAAIMTPMLNLNRLDIKRKGMITDCFNRIMRIPGLSDSIFEKIDKAFKQ